LKTTPALRRLVEGTLGLAAKQLTCAADFGRSQAEANLYNQRFAFIALIIS